MANDIDPLIVKVPRHEGDQEPLQLVTGERASVSSTTGDVLAIGDRARAYCSSYLSQCVAIGLQSLAETSDSGWCPAIAIGVAAKAIAYAEDETALASGYGVEAAALGRRGTAIAISFGDAHCIVSAGPGGRLIIVDPCMQAKLRATFEAHIDEETFLSGRRYTVNPRTGKWSEVQAGDCFAREERYPQSQVIGSAKKM